MESKKLEKSRKNGAFSTIQGVMKPDEETGGVSPTMRPIPSLGRPCAGRPRQGWKSWPWTVPLRPSR